VKDYVLCTRIPDSVFKNTEPIYSVRSNTMNVGAIVNLEHSRHSRVYDIIAIAHTQRNLDSETTACRITAISGMFGLEVRSHSLSLQPSERCRAYYPAVVSPCLCLHQ
jgi:hypothetical protein